MHPYLKHLLSDIQKAHNVADGELEEKVFMATDLETHFREIEAWVSGEGQKPFKDFCKLSKEDFPPANQLTKEEQLMVCEAFEDMLQSWNMCIDIPLDVPPTMRYNLTVNLLDNECLPTKMGTFHFDFCTGNTSDCELEMYCPCRKYEDETS
ncbi:MAG: hypothetical protein JJU02_04065 [Cryomorphaceae bacterium]|nr:hypothetical protein [Cryomorphaceae bacterium]